MLYLDSGGRISFLVDPGTPTTLRSSGAYLDSGWHHVAGSLGPAGLRLYLDGVLEAANTGVTTAGSYLGYFHANH
ncbi:LamG-like jellyroll fold domain-containing protein [Micromonosporaceae bacterium Da 78-11]